MTTQTPRKKKPLLTTLIITLAILGILAILAVTLAPRFLANQATQAPADTQTFVTRQIEESDLSSRMQAAINTPGQSQDNPPADNMQVNVESSTDETPTDNTSQTTQRAQMGIEQPISQDGSPENTIREIPLESGSATETKSSPRSQQRNTTASTSTVPPERRPARAPQNQAPQSQNDVPQSASKDFQFQISQNEISSMIYSGLVRGTAPAYRQSIQGVSTQISGGRAKITVALLPKYLPDAFLQRLPGIDRSTPTVYLGGEMGLSVSGNTVEPRIHRVSLGNMGVPLPFIESAVRSQVQAYVRQATRLPNGQQAQLQTIRLEGGAVQIQGRVD